MIRSDLSALLAEGLSAAQAAGDIAKSPSVTFAVERREDDLADYSSSEPMRLARVLGAAPRDIADAIVKHLPHSPSVRTAEVAGPGFINLWLKDEWVINQLPEIHQAGPSFGHTSIGEGLRVQVEFVSANPTGPLTAGAGRGGVVGDALTRILRAIGYEVTGEYYVNDAGYQVELLGLSVYHHYAAALGHEAPFPTDGYLGDYISGWAAQIADEDNDRWLNDEKPTQPSEFEARAVGIALNEIGRDLKDLNIEINSWFSEKSMRDRGDIETVLESLEKGGHVTRRDGAVWFVGGDGVNDRENVLVRSRGDPTYFAADIAYHLDKLERRNFDHVIDIWGADHHGHVPRVKAAMAALGVDSDASKLEILLTQMVGIRIDGELGRQGKRSGKFVTLRQLLDEVGPAATRYFFLSKAMDSQMEFDLELAKREDSENPIYYIQMAHARCAGIERTATNIPAPGKSINKNRLTKDDGALVRLLLAFPEILVDAGMHREPHRLTHYLLSLARTFHSYYNKHRVVTEDKVLTLQRLSLIGAVRQTFANGLELLGIDAPDRM